MQCLCQPHLWTHVPITVCEAECQIIVYQCVSCTSVNGVEKRRRLHSNFASCFIAKQPLIHEHWPQMKGEFYCLWDIQSLSVQARERQDKTRQDKGIWWEPGSWQKNHHLREIRRLLCGADEAEQKPWSHFQHSINQGLNSCGLPRFFCSLIGGDRAFYCWPQTILLPHFPSSGDQFPHWLVFIWMNIITHDDRRSPGNLWNLKSCSNSVDRSD